MTFLKKHDREVTFQVRQQIAALTPGFREDMGPHVESDNVYVIQVWMHVGRKSAGGVGAGLRVRREGGGGREGGIGEGRQRYAEAHTRTRGDTEKKHHRYPKLLPQALEFLHDTVNKLLYLRQASALC